MAIEDAIMGAMIFADSSLRRQPDSQPFVERQFKQCINEAFSLCNSVYTVNEKEALIRYVYREFLMARPDNLIEDIVSQYATHTPHTYSCAKAVGTAIKNVTYKDDTVVYVKFGK